MHIGRSDAAANEPQLNHIGLDMPKWTNIVSIMRNFGATLPPVAIVTVRRYGHPHCEDAHSCSSPLSSVEVTLAGIRSDVRRSPHQSLICAALGDSLSDDFAVRPPGGS